MTTTVKSAPFPALDIARNAFELEVLRAFRCLPDEGKTVYLAKLAEIVASIKPAKGKRRSGERAPALSLSVNSKVEMGAAHV